MPVRGPAPTIFDLIPRRDVPEKRRQMYTFLANLAPGPAGTFARMQTAASIFESRFGRRGEEAAKAAANQIANPADQVAQDFGGSIDLTTGTAGPEPTAPDLSQTAIPPPQITAGQIPGMYAGLLEQISGAAPPIGRPEPAAYSPAQTFLSTFAGIMGSQMARNPAIQETIFNKLQEREQRRQAIEDQNYANRLLFDQEKRNRLIALRGQILEQQIETALAQGNTEAARIAAQNLEKLRTEGQAYIEKLRQRGETERTRITAGARSAGKEAQGLKMNEFLQRVQDIQSAKPEQLKGGGGFLGLGGAVPLTKQDALLEAYAGAALGGADAAVQNLGFRRLVEGVKVKYKVGTKINEKQARNIATELLQRFALPPAVVDRVLGEFSQ